MKSDNIIVAFKLEDLTGEGTEYYVDSDGNVLAKFINGNLLNDRIDSVFDSTIYQ